MGFFSWRGAGIGVKTREQLEPVERNHFCDGLSFSDGYQNAPQLHGNPQNLDLQRGNHAGAASQENPTSVSFRVICLRHVASQAIEHLE